MLAALPRTARMTPKLKTKMKPKPIARMLIGIYFAAIFQHR